MVPALIRASLAEARHDGWIHAHHESEKERYVER
jgi:hypothetical protein